MTARIKEILDYYQLSPALFAEAIGINRSNLTHLFSGRNQPSLDLVKKILNTFPNIKTEWLILGMGKMFRDDDDESYSQLKADAERKMIELELFANKNKKEEELTPSSPPIKNKNETGKQKTTEKIVIFYSDRTFDIYFNS